MVLNSLRRSFAVATWIVASVAAYAPAPAEARLCSLEDWARLGQSISRTIFQRGEKLTPEARRALEAALDYHPGRGFGAITTTDLVRRARAHIADQSALSPEEKARLWRASVEYIRKLNPHITVDEFRGTQGAFLFHGGHSGTGLVFAPDGLVYHGKVEFLPKRPGDLWQEYYTGLKPVFPSHLKDFERSLADAAARYDGNPKKMSAQVAFAVQHIANQASLSQAEKARLWQYAAAHLRSDASFISKKFAGADGSIVFQGGHDGYAIVFAPDGKVFKGKIDPPLRKKEELFGAPSEADEIWTADYSKLKPIEARVETVEETLANAAPQATPPPGPTAFTSALKARAEAEARFATAKTGIESAMNLSDPDRTVPETMRRAARFLAGQTSLSLDEKAKIWRYVAERMNNNFADGFISVEFRGTDGSYVYQAGTHGYALVLSPDGNLYRPSLKKKLYKKGDLPEQKVDDLWEANYEGLRRIDPNEDPSLSLGAPDRGTKPTPAAAAPQVPTNPDASENLVDSAFLSLRSELRRPGGSPDLTTSVRKSARFVAGRKDLNMQEKAELWRQAATEIRKKFEFIQEEFRGSDGAIVFSAGNGSDALVFAPNGKVYRIKLRKDLFKAGTFSESPNADDIWPANYTDLTPIDTTLPLDRRLSEPRIVPRAPQLVPRGTTSPRIFPSTDF